MNDPEVRRALDRFVESFVPPSYRAAGTKPALVDMSLSLGDIRTAGAALLMAYDPVSAGWPDERAAAAAEIAALHETIAALEAQLPVDREAATSTLPPAVPVVVTGSTANLIIGTATNTAPPPEGP
jgi:hypothetical protein